MIKKTFIDMIKCVALLILNLIILIFFIAATFSISPITLVTNIKEFIVSIPGWVYMLISIGNLLIWVFVIKE